MIIGLRARYASPVDVTWLILDHNGNPVDGASVTIYYSQSTNGPFTPVPATIVEDQIANVYRNPVFLATATRITRKA